MKSVRTLFLSSHLSLTPYSYLSSSLFTKTVKMTRNLSAISEIKEAVDALYELNRDVTVLQKYGIMNNLTSQIQQLYQLGTAKLKELEKQH